MSRTDTELQLAPAAGLSNVELNLASAARFSDSRRLSYYALEPLIITIEAAIILGCSITAGVVYNSLVLKQIGTVEHYALPGILVSSIFIPGMKLRDQYRPTSLLSYRSQFRDAVFFWSLAFLFVFSFAFGLKVSDILSRGAVLSFMSIGLGAILVARFVLHRKVVKALADDRLPSRRVVLIGDAEDIAQVRIAEL